MMLLLLGCAGNRTGQSLSDGDLFLTGESENHGLRLFVMTDLCSGCGYRVAGGDGCKVWV